MVHIGQVRSANSNNFQIILKLLGYNIFCNNLQHKNNLKQICKFGGIRGINHLHYMVMLHVGLNKLKKDFYN